MTISIEDADLAEIDHRVANDLASLKGATRLQRGAIGKSGKTFTSDQICVLLDDISARLEVTARLHKSLALSENGNRVNLGDFLREISEMIGTLAPQGKMDLTFDNSGAGVAFLGGSGNTSEGNSIFGNAALGIDIGGDGVARPVHRDRHTRRRLLPAARPLRDDC